MAAHVDTVRIASNDEPAESRRTPPHGLSLLLIVCLCGGIASPVIGLVLTIVHSMVPGDKIFAKIAMSLTFVAIPLLLAGSHLMDVLARRRP